MQYIKFPMKYLNITRGYGVASHRYSYAIDNAGKDTGIDNVYAPYDGFIKKIWPNGNTVWLESTSKVKFANGATDYCTTSYTHDNIVSNLRVGQKIKQGQVFYQEGTAGNATGNHIHLEVARGKFTGTGWHQTPDGLWAINNGIKPESAFYINGVTVKNSGGYKWKKYKEDNMVSSTGVHRVTRLRLWRKASSAELKKYVGKYTEDGVDKDIMKTKEYKNHVAKVKKDKFISVDALGASYRKIFGVK